MEAYQAVLDQEDRFAGFIFSKEKDIDSCYNNIRTKAKQLGYKVFGMLIYKNMQSDSIYYLDRGFRMKKVEV